MSKVFVNRLYLGKHFADAASVRFKSVRVGFTNLEEWLGWSPFEFSHGTETSEISLHIPSPYRKHFEFHEPTRAAALSAWSMMTETSGRSRFGAEFNAHIELAPAGPSEFEWFYEVVFDVRNLLTLFVGSPVYVEMMLGQGDDIEYAPGVRRPEDIGIYFPIKRWPQRESVRRFEMPVTFQTIEGQASEVLGAWFSNAQKLRLVCELFFGAQYNDEMYVDSKFVNFTQALEIFHRVMWDGRHVPPEIYDVYREGLLAAIPREVPERLRQRFQNGINQANMYSLQDRLSDLIARLDPWTQDKILKGEESFARRVALTRNYLTHGGESLRAKALSTPWEYFRANQKLRTILSLHMLKMLGIPERQVAPALLRQM